MKTSAGISVLTSALLICILTSESREARIASRESGAIDYSERDIPDQSGPCKGCNEDSDVIRTQYHLMRIKDRIQVALGITSDGPKANVTMPTGSFLSRVEDLMLPQKAAEVFEPTTSERQILLAETEATENDKKMEKLRFKIPLNSRILASDLVLAECWLPADVVEANYNLQLKVGFKSRLFQMLGKSVPRERLRSALKPDGWSALSLTEEIIQYVKSSAREVLSIHGVKLILELSIPKQRLPGKDTSTKPFMVIEFSKRIRRRQRRGVECYKGKDSVCCREKLTVSFEEIGLQNHIIQPRQFEAYHCVGTCGTYSRSDTTRVEIVKYVLNSMRRRNQKTDHITFCCTAARTSSQKLLYYNNAKTEILTRVVDGLIIDECDCL